MPETSIISIQQALKISLNKYELTRLDAQILLCYCLSVTKEYLITHNNELLTKLQLEKYQNMCEKRNFGIPIAYLLGTKEFYSLDFYVNEDVLIPRPDTELLVDFAIQNAPINANVIDMGTGSGAIAIAAKHNRKDIHMYACDISKNALEVATKNADKNNVDIYFLHSNWFDNIDEIIKFDMILSNPPYIHKDDEHLNQEIRFEPRLALTDDEDGLKHIKTIIKQAKFFLKNNGCLAIEHGYDQSSNVKDIFLKYGYSNIKHILDLSGHIRVTYGLL